ncbi:hypothetical protein FHX74_000154 [Friedmanniella endophytica]|uniref:DMT family transporter n=1 Tax=Microlunatus kandeliicorticis TaxID=1759536 RepID=A0A7W3IP08_9ACTN|nr:DMT family transporter [Microlunatus kandeliicorticis]MBA8792560.1 hypothetical protein [Microlunatus kandeliicorticis]
MLAVIAAFASAASFATGSALQHRAVGQSTTRGSTRRTVQRLVRRPSWTLGLLLSLLAFALHAVALSQGALVLVQPIIVSGIVFAVIIRAGLERSFPPVRTIIWLVLTWGGLALFLAVRPDDRERDVHATLALVLTLVVASGVLGLRVVAARTRGRGRHADRTRGLLLGGSAGLLFGLVAGLLKLCLRNLGTEGLSGVFTHWPLYALVVVGVWAVILNQRAYSATKLSISAPTLNVAQVLIALLFGVVVLAEPIGTSTGQVITQLLGLLIMIAGIVRLASLD